MNDFFSENDSQTMTLLLLALNFEHRTIWRHYFIRHEKAHGYATKQSIENDR